YIGQIGWLIYVRYILRTFWSIFRKLYVVIFALLLFPVGWSAGLYMAKLTENNKWGYGFGFVLGIIFLASPFIVNWVRTIHSKPNQPFKRDA
ncbi:MAG TPA: hypothetical protein DCW48_00765, partial [Methylotenera mobilis]|nr:hypothetical protein [Methylotenera mobilis]